MSEPLPALDLFVPDEFRADIDEHGAHRLSPIDAPPFTIAELLVSIAPTEPDEFVPNVTRAIAAHRVSLSDAKVVHSAYEPSGFFGGSQWEYVIAYRSGIFSYTLFLWYVHLPDRACAVNAAGVCISEDSAIFYPIFRLVLQQSSVGDVVPA